ncbi:MAG: hypothetical protein ABI446_13120 [Gemmatimonadaceae bacterium]
MTNRSDIHVRRATIEDVAALVHQRVSMYRDMGEMPESKAAEFTSAASTYFRAAITSGEYIAWHAVAGGV